MLAASSGCRLRRSAADRHASRYASRDLCSGGAPRRYPLSAVLRMLNEKIGALPVVDDTGRLVGLLSQTDLLKALALLLGRDRLAPPMR